MIGLYNKKTRSLRNQIMSRLHDEKIIDWKDSTTT